MDQAEPPPPTPAHTWPPASPPSHAQLTPPISPAAHSQRLEAAKASLALRVEQWDADELALKWAATASWLHPKDQSTAALLERRRVCYRRAEQLLRQAPAVERSLPERLASLEQLQVIASGLPLIASDWPNRRCRLPRPVASAGCLGLPRPVASPRLPLMASWLLEWLQGRCEEVQLALLAPRLLQSEELVVADALHACAATLTTARQRSLAAMLATEHATDTARAACSPTNLTLNLAMLEGASSASSAAQFARHHVGGAAPVARHRLPRTRQPTKRSASLEDAHTAWPERPRTAPLTLEASPGADSTASTCATPPPAAVRWREPKK